jgi:hypothetical protein
MRAMKRKATQADWLPLSRSAGKGAELPTGEAFRPEWIDFERGIQVGNIQPHERITQILKYRLEQAWDARFVTDRWGRGVYWQWICWLPRANREAKPVSHDVNFGCAKLYIQADRERRLFQCGMAVERGVVTGSPSYPGIKQRHDWDWHRFIKQCDAGTDLDRELRRLVAREGFRASITGRDLAAVLGKKDFTGARQLRDLARKAPPDAWAGFDLFYPMPESEVKASTGYELVQGILGAFAEVVPAMNLCMQVPLLPRAGAFRSG